jgi:plasmid stabilization system protein ParE
MKKSIATTPLADLQILEIDAWWRENRDKAPDLFEEELALAFRILESAPGAGRKYPHPSGSVRRLLLRSTRNHVYYVERDDCVLVVAVWGAVKGTGPDLTAL